MYPEMNTTFVISHLYSNMEVIKISSIKKITPKKYDTKELSFLCLPILNYCIVIVSVRYSSTQVVTNSL
jgi:hypothetical protein